MCTSAALVVDNDGLQSSFNRARPHEHWRSDLLKLIRYLQEHPFPRVLLWSKWVVPSKPEGDPAWGFYAFLKSQGMRLQVVERKPINLFADRYEPNLGDDCIAEAIHLAAVAAQTVIVAGNDGHLAAAIDTAQNRYGRRVEVVCDRVGLSSRISADYFHVLDDLVRRYDLERREGDGVGTPREVRATFSSLPQAAVQADLLTSARRPS